MKTTSAHAHIESNLPKPPGIFSGIFGQIFRFFGPTFSSGFLSLGIFLGIFGCGDVVPDNDVQFSFESGVQGEELHTHVSNALATLQPHLDYLVDARDPAVTGLTWRSADQWQVVVRPRGYHVPPDGVLCEGTTLAITSYRRKVLYVGECVFESDKWDLGTIIRHELGHVLGFADHLPSGNVLAADLYEGQVLEYTPADLQAISDVRRDESNDLIESCWTD